MSKKLNYIDLFAGCGGLSEGFESKKRFRMLAAVEWDKSARNSLADRMKSFWKYPNAEEVVTRFDIQRTHELFTGWGDCDEYEKHCGLDALVGKQPVDLIIGGPPCQAYSMAGRVRDANGMHDDYRNYLFESFLEVVVHYQPKMIVFENVPGMLSAQPNGVKISDRISEQFAEAGYKIHMDLKKAVFDASLYGVPQKRKRVIICGVSKQHYGTGAESMVSRFYESLRGSEAKSQKTVSDAIGNFPEFFPAESEYKLKGRKYSHTPAEYPDLPNHIPRFHNKRDIKIFQLLCDDIVSKKNKYATSDALKKLYTRETGRTSAVHKYHVLRWDSPSNLIPAHLFKDGLRHIHPDPKQARSITVREAATLQSFPMNYEFKGSMGDQYKMIGNAVPPQLARCIADSIIKLMD